MIAINTEGRKKPIRFAALRRVSTERQDKTGESLLTQKTDIEKYVVQLGGHIVAWYGGQEHATPGYEKKEIDRLLSDAQRGKFDAVIVTDADRWSRDNAKSSAGLDLFKQHGIKFFIGTREWDLYNPEHCLYLGMSSVIGQFYASNQKRKSLNNRIHRAVGGRPTCGKLPYGRTYDEKTGWAIDKEKQATIQTIAKRYLAGEQLSELAEEFEMNHSNLHKILTKRCGGLWEIEFNSDDLKIHEKVEMKIPQLLPYNIIAAVLKKADANRTYLHGHGRVKNHYLLGRMVFCKHCGYTMFGQTNHNGHRYYRHAHTKRERKCNCPDKTWIKADELEDIVMRYLFECFGNPQAVQRAIEKAIPNLEKIREYQNRLEHIAGETNKVKSGREKILRLVANGHTTESQAAKQLEELTQKEAKLQIEEQQLRDNIENSPSPDKIKTLSKNVSNQFRSYQLRISTIRHIALNKPYDEMTYKNKRALVEMVFSSKTPDGQRMGVYIESGEKGWQFDIHGHLIDEQGLFPLSDSRKEAYFGDGMGNVWKQRKLLKVIKPPLY